MLLTQFTQNIPVLSMLLQLHTTVKILQYMLLIYRVLSWILQYNSDHYILLMFSLLSHSHLIIVACSEQWSILKRLAHKYKNQQGWCVMQLKMLLPLSFVIANISFIFLWIIHIFIHVLNHKAGICKQHRSLKNSQVRLTLMYRGDGGSHANVKVISIC